MKIAIITATPQNVRLGSGTFVANALPDAALRSQGHVVDVVSPEAASGPLGHVAHRFLWNARLDPRVFDGCDVVVGYDMDGFAVIGRLGVPFVSYIHGIIADEAGFERGWTRKALRSMAEAERRAVHRADMVVTTSDYAAARLRQLYRHDGDVEVVPPAHLPAKVGGRRRRRAAGRRIPRAGQADRLVRLPAVPAQERRDAWVSAHPGGGVEVVPGGGPPTEFTIPG